MKLEGTVGFDTFGYNRYLNQEFYSSKIWKNFIRDINIRDGICDMGLDGYPIAGKIFHHHITPISESDLIHKTDLLLDPENIICVSFQTHNAIHYGSFELINKEITVRSKNDTAPWRN